MFSVLASLSDVLIHFVKDSSPYFIIFQVGWKKVKGKKRKTSKNGGNTGNYSVASFISYITLITFAKYISMTINLSHCFPGIILFV